MAYSEPRCGSWMAEFPAVRSELLPDVGDEVLAACFQRRDKYRWRLTGYLA
jgi:hypothetical protein